MTDSKQSLTVTDNRTGKTVDIPIFHGQAIRSKHFFQNFKLRPYDPGYSDTCAGISRITYIDGAAGKLQYRGYPIEQLAEHSTFEEVAFLVIYGELPSEEQLSYFRRRVMRHTYVHEDLKQMMSMFRFNAHPMGMLMSTVAAESTFHPEANPALAGQDIYKPDENRNKQIHRIIGNTATIAAFSYRHSIGRPYVNPAPAEANMSYAENFLYMLDNLSHRNYKPHPILAKALDTLFILHVDHEFNCSTSAMRHLTSSGVDVYSSLAGSMAALYGPLHGGANEAVLRMLTSIGSVENVPAFVEKVKKKQVKLMGFGHRVYKNYDPRARIVRQIADQVFDLLGREPLIEVAEALEKHALSDPYFIERKLYPNVDFYSGLIYRAMGFPTDFMVVLFTIPRVVGWLAHWNEYLNNRDKESRIVRPRQIYLGEKQRDYVPIAERTTLTEQAYQGLPESAQSVRMAAGEQAALKARM
jgi:citrate synthase